MSMSCTRPITIVLMLMVSFNFSAQENFEGLGESAFALNHNASNNYKINFALRSRYYLYQDETFNFENRQLDLVHFSTYSLDYNHSLSLGIQYRFRESIDGGDNELRFTQQFNYTKTNEAKRFGHRLRTEQRLFDDLTIIRFRYRFALDAPLNGEKLDVGESYIMASMEALLSCSNLIKPEVDHRTTLQMGWLLSQKLKLQLGLEYRFESFNIITEEKLFLLSSCILKI